MKAQHIFDANTSSENGMFIEIINPEKQIATKVLRSASKCDPRDFGGNNVDSAKYCNYNY